jgi:hypothetical protein
MIGAGALYGRDFCIVLDLINGYGNGIDRMIPANIRFTDGMVDPRLSVLVWLLCECELE